LTIVSLPAGETESFSGVQRTSPVTMRIITTLAIDAATGAVVADVTGDTIPVLQ